MLKILLIIVLLPIAIGIVGIMIKCLFESLPELIIAGAIRVGFILVGGVFLALGWTLSTLILTILTAIHAISVLKSRRRTWKEAFSFCVVVSSPALILSQIASMCIDTNLDYLEAIFCITTLIYFFAYFFASNWFIGTFDKVKNL